MLTSLFSLACAASLSYLLLRQPWPGQAPGTWLQAGPKCRPYLYAETRNILARK